jgi:hypothetical protein
LLAVSLLTSGFAYASEGGECLVNMEFLHEGKRMFALVALPTPVVMGSEFAERFLEEKSDLFDPFLHEAKVKLAGKYLNLNQEYRTEWFKHVTQFVVQVRPKFSWVKI